VVEPVQIVEVGPRDGLQAEPKPVSLELKLGLIRNLAAAGLRRIEAASFVRPDRVPQMADGAELWPQLPTGPRYMALVPNARGLERALALGVREIAVFTGASEAFVEANIGMSIADSLTAFRGVIEGFRAATPEGFVRGYVSTAFECPYSGPVEPEAAAQVGQALVEMGVDEIAFADTIGKAGPSEVKRLLRVSQGGASVALHFHDTWGTAIANVAAGLEMGVRVFDASAGGLGGCPFAPGAGGNLATEDLVYFLEREGLETGVDLDALARASEAVLRELGRQPWSRVQSAVLGSGCR
jgi:hydroxymethylglutaryl-CoA lyase